MLKKFQDEVWFSDVDVDQESLIEDIVINDEIYDDLFNHPDEVSFLKIIDQL